MATGAVTGVGRRVHLDGLRAVAVGVVVAFHAGVGRFAGGFVGVDVFFVLSGYLVTEVLLRGIDAEGRVLFGRFYARRVRRLLPAAVLVLLVVAATFSGVVGPLGREALGDSVRAALLYVANWHFIGISADYFSPDSPSPVLHMWSLAVEEQYYLVWPVLLAGLMRLVPSTDRGRRIAAGVVVVVGLCSLGAALVIRGGHLERAYYGTDVRAYQLLAGSVLALLPGIVVRLSVRRRLAGVLAAVGLAAIVAVASYRVDVDPITRGVLATVASLVVLVGLDAAPRSLAARVLSLGPVVAIGQISYGIYLWHWPVVLMIDELVEVSTPSRLMLTTLVSVGLASASHRLLEAPILTSASLDRLRWPVAAVGVSMSVISALVIVPALTDTGRAAGRQDAAPSEVGWGTPVPPYDDLYQIAIAGTGKAVTCVDGEPHGCNIVEGDGPHVLVLGDSVAESLTEGFVTMAEERGLSLSVAVTRGCPWQRDHFYFLAKEVRDECARQRTDAYDRVIPELDPDIIILVSASMVEDDARIQPDTNRARALSRTTDSSLAELQDGHRQVVVIEPLPIPVESLDEGPLMCLLEGTYVEECRFVARPSQSWLVERLRNIAVTEERVTVIDIGRLVCPYLPVCDPIIDGRIVWWDDKHVTPDFAATMGPPLGDALEAAGVLVD